MLGFEPVNHLFGVASSGDHSWVRVTGTSWLGISKELGY